MDSELKRVRPIEEEKGKEKEIPLYLIVAKTIMLNVKQSESIGHVKALLHDKQGIPVCLQQLHSGDDKLEDRRKLVDYGICENSTLHDSAKEGKDSGKFSLFHDGKFLEDGKTLAFLNIDYGSTLHMVRNPGDRFLITVVMPDYQVEKIEGRATLFVFHVKTAIVRKAGKSIGDKPLFKKKRKLEDEKQLYYYDIKEGCVLLVVEGTMQIIVVKRTDRECAILDVHKNNSVKEEKEMVLNKLGIPVHLQELMFEGKGLVDSRALSGYEIHNDSILYLDVHNCTENHRHSTLETGLLHNDTQPH
ncbi:hypothetical protein CQW23_09506 [Capsicum baccatum]|uniref:Ubiquitin-like domain-containing protein n=1 Tax=Capsicum baccatum TaxID=33114 RepID=A0A2G2WX58_CAPBA|nr:hypothetical protein CQW23_09506 [Capsicum baccatum]